jgi:hypothetical protein
VTTQHPEAQPSANTVRQCRLFGGGLRRGGGGFNFQFNSYSRRGLSFYLFALGGFIGHHRLPATGCAAARRRRGVLVCCARAGPSGLGGWGAAGGRGFVAGGRRGHLRWGAPGAPMPQDAGCLRRALGLARPWPPWLLALALALMAYGLSLVLLAS